MNKKISLIIVVVLLILAGLFVFLRADEDNTSDSVSAETSQDGTSEKSATETDSELEADSDVVTVTYTDDGFSPAEQTVVVGQTVRFINNSSASMWVASDDHPAHTDLPEFDNKQGVGSGETYEHTFTEAGEWGYHNHLNDSDEGTIIVVEG